MANILLIEDEEEEVEIYAEQLSEWGYDVKAVVSSEEAEKLLTQDKFDLILLDLEIPKSVDQGKTEVQNGLNLINFVRNKRNLPVPILVISGLLTMRQILKNVPVFKNISALEKIDSFKVWKRKIEKILKDG